MASKFYCALFIVLFVTGCSKHVTKPDPRKEQNNLLIETDPPILKSVIREVSSSIHGYYVSLPSLYDSTSKNYPLIISLHGAGTFGDGSTQLSAILADGLPKVLNEGRFPASFTVNHQNFSFITIAPQFKSMPGFSEVQFLIAFAKKNYRIDPSRVYLTGLSMGSSLSWYAGIEYSNQVTAIVPVSGIPRDSADIWARRTARSGVPIWSFQNNDDTIISPMSVKNFIGRINSFNPVFPPKFTLFPTGGHNAWTLATDPNYKEYDMNIYEWMLQYKK